jgi:hypothetical protein
MNLPRDLELQRIALRYKRRLDTQAGFACRLTATCCIDGRDGFFGFTRVLFGDVVIRLGLVLYEFIVIGGGIRSGRQTRQLALFGWGGVG